ERYNAIVNRSPKDLNHPKLYKQGASPSQSTHSLTLSTIFDLESHNPISGLLGLFTFILTSLSAIVLGYAEELVLRRHIFLPRSLRLEKEVDQRNQTIQQLETTLRELLERQTREAAIASEVVKRTEELAKKQQALLDEAERREKDRQEKLSSRIPTMVDHDSKIAESKDHTWRPSTVVTKVPGREKSNHPFSSHILAE
ncbi:hypothetical protein PIB30_094629, partial [Stylosanthes scabra]|nr:hypothetical protein [Stylosanthes scabra]